MFSISSPASKSRAIAGGALLLFVAESAQAQFSGSATLVSDYVWRGSSQTREAPAAQAGLKYGHASGIYVSAWGSSVKYEPANGAASEMDGVIGWSGMLAEDWALDVSLLRYEYPSADTKLDWNEVNASVTWQDRFWLALAYSTNAMASKTEGAWSQFGARHAFNDQWRAEASLARYFLDDAYAKSYSHAAASAIWAFAAPFEARITLHGTDQNAKALFPDMAGTRAEFALQAAF
ncbi:Hypothetical protein HDN1F_36050 [gamma proteobacterium HdN1]|nr:Hypothetical protein HDN1F_36050 [gamma proteobacterium HdN1]